MTTRDNDARKFVSCFWVYMAMLPFGCFFSYLEFGTAGSIACSISFAAFSSVFSRSILIDDERLIIRQPILLYKVVIPISEIDDVSIRKAALNWDYVEICARGQRPVRLYRGSCFSFDELASSIASRLQPDR
jgi:hypothetical protein